MLKYRTIVGLLFVIWLTTPTIPVLAGSTLVLLYQKTSSIPSDRIGFCVASAGDVNGDGRADFIIGAPFASPGGLTNSGSVYVYSGANGSLLYRKDGAAAHDNFGYSVASAGDINGDGRADFIIGAYLATGGGVLLSGSAYVYSGVDGSLIYQKNGSAINDELGVSVASAGDINGDGKVDFIVGAYYTSLGGLSQAGSAYVYSGADGSLLYQLNGSAAGDHLGYSVASAGDVNGDGKPDFIIGAYFARPGGRYAAGSAYVYSGADGSLLYQKDGAAPYDYLGYPVASAGDVNGDGKDDFIIGALAADPNGLTDAGSAYVYSGADGSLLFQENGEAAGDWLGASVASAGDVNGDGKADFIVAAYLASPRGLSQAGSVYLYSGADGTLLHRIDGVAADDLLGRSVASAGDVDGDGKPDVIVGAPYASSGGIFRAGAVYVYSLQLCAATKGDMNASGDLSPVDIVLLLNCDFLSAGRCDLCFADVNCSGDISLADVMVELNAVFLGIPFPC